MTNFYNFLCCLLYVLFNHSTAEVQKWSCHLRFKQFNQIHLSNCFLSLSNGNYKMWHLYMQTTKLCRNTSLHIIPCLSVLIGPVFSGTHGMFQMVCYINSPKNVSPHLEKIGILQKQKTARRKNNSVCLAISVGVLALI